MPRPSHSSRFHHSNNIVWAVQMELTNKTEGCIAVVYVFLICILSLLRVLSTYHFPFDHLCRRNIQWRE
jgi:hypothetical protein